MEINPTNNPDVVDRGVEDITPEDVQADDLNAADDEEDRKEAVISADDTGMLSNERLITDGEIERGEHPERR
ncbi:MAG TPA: hypothetical protein VIG51_08300 [Candidatus Baltobacteraceae bacterium]|jgi:hypothetical protein